MTSANLENVQLH